MGFGASEEEIGGADTLQSRTQFYERGEAELSKLQAEDEVGDALRFATSRSRYRRV
jgi:hypothetical protein